jgi:hypothetical protein
VWEFLVSNDLYFNKINVSPNHIESDLEIRTFELENKLFKSIILSLNTAPAGDFSQFIKNLDDDMQHLHELRAKLLTF